MITLTYVQASSQNFQEAFRTIASTRTDGHTAYRINKIVGDLEKSLAKIQEEYRAEILDVYTKPTEGAVDVLVDREPIEEKKAEYEAAQKAFGEKTFTIDRHKLTFHDLRDMKVSARMVHFLEPILAEDSAHDALSPMKPRIA